GAGAATALPRTRLVGPRPRCSAAPVSPGAPPFPALTTRPGRDREASGPGRSGEPELSVTVTAEGHRRRDGRWQAARRPRGPGRGRDAAGGVPSRCPGRRTADCSGRSGAPGAASTRTGARPGTGRAQGRGPMGRARTAPLPGHSRVVPGVPPWRDGPGGGRGNTVEVRRGAAEAREGHGHG